MRTEEKKRTKFIKGISGIMLMLMCVLAFSWVVGAAIVDQYIYSAEGAGCGYAVYGKIKKNQDGDLYSLYNISGDSSSAKRGYFLVKLKLLSELDSNEDLSVSAFTTEFSFTIKEIWKYSGKMKRNIKFKVGAYENSSFYFHIGGPENMKYQFYVEFHETENWETEPNNSAGYASPVDVNKTIHGNTVGSNGSFDYDYYEIDIPSPGIITFEMDRTPKNNHGIMIFDGKKSQLWKTKATSENHIVSKKIKVKTGKIYIRIFGKNSDQYDFRVTHKQTTNTPNKTRITGIEGLDKGFQVTWMNPGGKLSGYQIQYAKDSSFKQGVKSKWVKNKNKNKNKVSIGGLEKDTAYYVKIRSYYKDNGKTYYSDWSNYNFVRTLKVSTSEVKPAGLKMISCGNSATAFLKKDGSLWVCGYGEYGGLANSSKRNIEKPEKILDNVRFVCLSVDDLYVIKNDDTLWGRGDNSFGELADGTNKTKTKFVKIMSDVRYVDSLSGTTAIIKNDNSLWTVGSNDRGQIGDGTKKDRYKPVKIMKDVDTVSAGGGHLMIIKKDGSLWGCGDNRSGELGDGTDIEKIEPAKIMDNVRDVKTGLSHTVILKKDGSLWTCGYNEYGQIGDGTTDIKLSPVKIKTGVKSIDCSTNYTVFITNDGTLWGFGDNGTGNLGDGTHTNRLKPTKISTDVEKVSAGSSHLGIIKKDGVLWMCGSNVYNCFGAPASDTVDSRLNAIPLQLK